MNSMCTMLKIYNAIYKYHNTHIIIFTASIICYKTVHVKPTHNSYNTFGVLASA